jgi:hypothetical protein
MDSGVHEGSWTRYSRDLVSTEGMSVKSLSGLKMPWVVPGISLNQNGAISSEGTPLISMLSTVVSTLSDLCCTTLQNLVNSRSTTQKLSPLCRLKWWASGTPPGQRPLKRLYLHSHIDDLSSMNIEGTVTIQSMSAPFSICFSYSCMLFNLPHLYTCSHDYSDSAVVLTHSLTHLGHTYSARSINSYPG